MLTCDILIAVKTITRHLTFFAPAAVLSTWGTVMIFVLVTGRINQLLTPMFRDYVLVAGILLLVLSVAHLVLFQPIPQAEAAFPRQSKGLLKATFLILPLLFSAFLAPSALSVTTFENRSDSNSATPSAGMIPPTQDQALNAEINSLLATNPNQPVSVEITDLMALATMPDKIKAFTERPVKIVGQYADLPDGTKRIYRLLMWCCAADAKPVSVNLEFPAPGSASITMPDPKLPNGTAWVEVSGHVRYETTADGGAGGTHLKPILHVDSFHPTDEPDEPFLSPF